MTSADREPGELVLDAHHHLWDPADGGHGWLDAPAHAPIRRRYTLADLRAAAPSEVRATVLVQALAETAETERLLATAAGSGLVAGVVGWVDLTADGVDDELDRLRACPGGDRLVGVRHLAQDEPDPRWLTRTDVARGIAAVGRRGLAVDLLVRAPQRAAALGAARAAPGVRFVLDHAGKPAIGAGEWEPWASWLAELAALRHVTCKLSGLVTEAKLASRAIDTEAKLASRAIDTEAKLASRAIGTEAAPGRHEPARLLPYARHVLASFGPDRVMFGSDWPVCELAGGYPAVWALARRCLAELSAPERSAVLARTATRTYRPPRP